MSAAWVPVSCHVADVIRHSDMMHPISTLTDLDGGFGEPQVYTMWGFDDERPVMREWRWPGGFGKPDVKPCEHEVMGA